jgi:adenosylcobinamide kinase/adenosylcobinamide-phosphate guanylyltransferase
MMFDEFMEFDELSVQDINKLELKIVNEIETIIDSMKEKEGTHIIITNEVGLSLISEYKLGRIFTDIIGRVNQKIANRADQVYMIISGIELLVKG